jgi:hypothetical protein
MKKFKKNLKKGGLKGWDIVTVVRHLWDEKAVRTWLLLHFYRFKRMVTIGNNTILPIQGCL